jgi:nucleoside-diphosphate-sugar epimerase
MQTILGANGQIAEELARELHKNYTTAIRLVSRNPKKINQSDQLVSANLLDCDATDKAIEGSEIVYFTAGLPMNASMWKEQFPIMMQNVIQACKKYHCRLVFFDNTYMYAKTNEPQTEESSFTPSGSKSTTRSIIAKMVLDEIEKKSLEAVICRAPEFYGPGKTQSITNALIFDKIKQNKKIKIPISDTTLRTLIWTPDASRAMALIGNTKDAFYQTWHLPCDDNRLTYKEIIDLTSKSFKQEFSYSIIKMGMFKIFSLFNANARELLELLPRYEQDAIFVSDKFKKRFPEFKYTSYKDGIKKIMTEQTSYKTKASQL